MMFVGTIAAAVAIAAVVLSSRPSSSVDRRLDLLIGARPQRRIPFAADELLIARSIATLVAGVLGAALATFTPLGVLPIAALVYGGWIAPSIVVERRVAAARRAAQRSAVTLVEWLHALVASGRPPEAALADIAARGIVDGALGTSLAHVRHDYLLGVPLRHALVREGATAGIPALSDLAATLERARDLGRGAMPLLQDLRDDLRAAERTAALAAAAGVEGKLTAVMTLCYLPALALLVIVPLFVTLLSGLFSP